MFRALVVIWLVLSPLSVVAQDSAEMQLDTERIDAQSRYLILAEIGFGGGWPGYQLYNLNVALQREQFGVALRGSLTEVGPFVALSGRYYLPLDFVPTFVSLGLGYFDAAPVVSATLGANIPLGFGSPWRITLEAGGAVTTLLGQRRVLPTVAASIGYSFFVDQPPITAEDYARRRDEEIAARAGCVEIRTPDGSTLGSSISAAIEREAARARVAFPGYNVSDLSYSYDTTIDGDTAYLSGTWSATVISPGGSESVSSGTLEARFIWTGCSWSLAGYTVS
jgi:hypothetical protein